MIRRLAVVALAIGMCARSVWATGACDGDCNGDGTVSVDELVRGVNIALGNIDASQCGNFDGNHDSKVTVDELVTGVNGALNGCAYLGTFYGTASLSGGQTAAVNLSAHADGQMTGTMTVRDGASGSSFFFDTDGEAATTIGIGSLGGSVDLDNGAFTIDGSITINGIDFPIHIAGTLPGLSNGGGSFSGQLGDETLSGSVVSGDGSTPTPTRTRPPTTSTPTPTSTPTSPAATATTVRVNTPTPTIAIVAPGIAADLLGTWSGSARNDVAGVNKPVRILVAVVSNQIQVSDLNHNLLSQATVTAVPAGTRAFVYNRTSGNTNENLTLNSLFPGGLAGLYERTTLTFPPQIEGYAVDLHKEP